MMCYYLNVQFQGQRVNIRFSLPRVSFIGNEGTPTGNPFPLVRAFKRRPC